MRIVEDTVERLHVTEGYDWTKLIIGAVMLALPAFPYFLTIGTAMWEHRFIVGQRHGEVVTLALRVRAPFKETQMWPVNPADIDEVTVTAAPSRTRKGHTYTLYTLGLTMKEGTPWSLFSWADDKTPLEMARRRIEHFLHDPSVREITVHEPHTLGMVDGMFLVLATLLPALPIGGWLIWRGLATFTLIADGRKRTLTIAAGSPGVRRPRTLSFDEIVAVAPFDPQDRPFRESFSLVIETRSYGRVKLGVLTGESGFLPTSLAAVAGGKTGGDPGTTGHAQIAGRLHEILSIEKAGPSDELETGL